MVRLAAFPEAGAAYLLGTRRFPLDTVPYYLDYRLTGSEVVVVALAHTSQRPGYWADR